MKMEMRMEFDGSWVGWRSGVFVGGVCIGLGMYGVESGGREGEREVELGCRAGQRVGVWLRM